MTTEIEKKIKNNLPKGSMLLYFKESENIAKTNRPHSFKAAYLFNGKRFFTTVKNSRRNIDTKH